MHTYAVGADVYACACAGPDACRPDVHACHLQERSPQHAHSIPVRSAASLPPLLIALTLTLLHRLLKEPRPLVVGIAWVVECAEQCTRVDEDRFLISLDGVNVAGTQKVRPLLFLILPHIPDRFGFGWQRRRSMLPRQFHTLQGAGADADTDTKHTSPDAASPNFVPRTFSPTQTEAQRSSSRKDALSRGCILADADDFLLCSVGRGIRRGEPEWLKPDFAPLGDGAQTTERYTRDLEVMIVRHGRL